MHTNEIHQPAADRVEHGTDAVRLEEAAKALRSGPTGALAVASISVAVLFIGWIAFYFLLFLPRGPIG